jgi:succinate-semialdehyde dehydrogenase/glutarate-semialdehyde dehydrogenase
MRNIISTKTTALRVAASRYLSTTQSINPATSEVVNEYSFISDAAAGAIVDDAHAEFPEWSRAGFAERAALFRKLAATLRESKANFAHMAAVEMGKPLAEGLGEIEKCAGVCEYYADNAATMLAPEVVDTGLDVAAGEGSYVTFSPLGVVFIVMPWNFPFWQVFRQAACGMSAGNTMVLKHAPNVFGCAQLVEEAFLKAGFPRNAFRNLAIDGPQASELIDHPRVRAVAFTGSTPVGKIIGARAGAALKPHVLELGGSDPYLILRDADIEEAAKRCAAGRLLNCGQSCIGAKRFIAVDEVYDEFEAAFADAIEAGVTMGDPLDAATTLGPMRDAASRDGLLKQVETSIDYGARLVVGTTTPARHAFLSPIILGDVHKGSPAYGEELFGPAASLIRATDEADAIAVANDTTFGLGAAVFTRDLERGARIAEHELVAGMAFVNDFVKSDSRLPFGGVKESGVGRECSHYGIKEFVNIKTVRVVQ